MDPFGTLLRWQRREKDLTLADVAQRAGKSVAQVSAWETGRERPDKLGHALMAYGVDDPELVHAALVLDRIPVQPPRDPEGPTFKSYGHDPAAGEACPCNECRAAWFEANACPTCGGDGLQPGTTPPESSRIPTQEGTNNG